MKPLSCPSQFILSQQSAVKNNFQEKELSHKCLAFGFVRLFVAAAATVYPPLENSQYAILFIGPAQNAQLPVACNTVKQKRAWYIFSCE